ncbi:hypothetical protein PSMK_08930 [Phycisphaera mikurensis NBRC 102666]|uniref:Uncharacterized protein n=1 Tax=Phycisphaera mikurensis (strain NBRC 102666 / KCTC 22515 / FYK2301M01) TaxID=1142394 RepID=I0ICR4_PHYMF|nr:hypothetical protein PSMK_08930 [Phycisphaera mikurensis NBRC 102666]
MPPRDEETVRPPRTVAAGSRFARRSAAAGRSGADAAPPRRRTSRVATRRGPGQHENPLRRTRPPLRSRATSGKPAPKTISPRGTPASRCADRGQDAEERRHFEPGKGKEAPSGGCHLFRLPAKA